MFEKLLSALPYNPSMGIQLAFYARRMRQETSIRRLGLVFIVLAFVVQFVAVADPPKLSANGSPNDLIYGGITSVTGAVNACNNNTGSYGTVLNYYGISCADVAKAATVYIRSTDYNKTLWSVGRLPYGKTGETPVKIGSGTYYWRYLWSWDTIPYSTYKTLELHSSLTGKTYFILYSCGNLVSIGFPTQYVPPAPAVVTPQPQPAPTPPPLPCKASINAQDTLACVQVSKTASNITENIADANNTTAQPGDVITYILHAQNTGSGRVTNFQFQENLSDVLVYADLTDGHGGTLDSSDIISWPAIDISANASVTQQLTVTVKKPLPTVAADPTDPARYDLTMTNVYGNTINIKLPPPVATTVATTTAKLPNTGPGSSLIIAGAIALLSGYLAARSRLLATEGRLAAQATSGGTI